jgi:hypothetical protein
MGVTISRVCFGKVKSEARPNQLITFARCLREALPIKYRDLPSAAFNQTSTFKLAGSIRDGWPLDTQHFGEQVLSDREHVTVIAVTHHKQPAR